MRLLSVNIEGDLHFELIIPWVREVEPDIICFQEVFEADIPFIKHSLSVGGFFLPMVNATEENRFRVSIRGKMGTAIFSAHEMGEGKLEYYQGGDGELPVLRVDTVDLVWHGLQSVEVEVGGEKYEVITTHFNVTKEGEVTKLQQDNLEKMLKILVGHEEFILCGDFNAPRGREIFDMLAARYKDNIPKEVVTTLDAKIHRVGDKLPDFVVDGCFTTPGFEVRKVEVKAGVSDHCGVIADIVKKY